MSSESEIDPRGSSRTPPEGQPRREGNDSLWKRARRTLGTQNLGFLQPTARPQGAPSSGPPAPNKRREQVRQAQRTHRQRTQNYIKTLESEVVRLRESETDLLGQRDRLTNTVAILKNTIISNNIPLPPGTAQDDIAATTVPPTQPQFGVDATVSYGQDQFNHQRLHVTWPEFSEQLPAQAYSQGQAGTTQTYGDDSWFSKKPLPDLPNDFSFNDLSVSEEPPASPRLAVASPKPAKLPDAVDSLETAIDFVLALEHPCMAHIPFPADPGGDEPATHMMLASTPLFAEAPKNPTQSPPMSWQANSNVIKQLLNLSKSIQLEGEVTPVEAWHILSAHPHLSQLGRQGVEKLKGQLSSHVRCEGFGAVIDERVFWFYFNQLNERLF